MKAAIVSLLRGTAVAASMAGIAGCNVSDHEVIVLPEGDIARGEEAFVALECTSCHTVSNMTLPDPEELGPVTIVLGGEVAQAQTYGELVTSIINPSHRLARNPFNQEIAEDGQSNMPIYNDVMSVTELVDIVTFLNAHYRTERPPYRYPVYDY